MSSSGSNKIQTIIDNTTPDAPIVIGRYLANGWYSIYDGLTITIMEKEVNYGT